MESGVQAINHAGLDRTYRLHLPRALDPATPTPLILAFHGWGGDENSILDTRAVRRLANQAGMIVAAPRGLGATEDRPNAWTFPGSATGLDGDGVNQSVPGDTALTCNPNVMADETYPSCGPIGSGTAQNICSWTHCQADDTAFAAALLTELETQLCIDTDRVFAMGASNGGMFVWGLGQDPGIAPRLTAIAALIGLPHRGYDAPPDHALPALVITAEDDATVPSGAWDDPSFTTSTDDTEYYYSSATGITQSWSTAHACDITQPAASVDFGGWRFDCRSHCAAPSSTALPPVLDCRMGGGHNGKLRRTWPLIIDFFKSHSPS